MRYSEIFTWKTVVLNHGSIRERGEAVLVSICLTSSTRARACYGADISCVIVADVDLELRLERAQERVKLTSQWR